MQHRSLGEVFGVLGHPLCLYGSLWRGHEQERGSSQRICYHSWMASGCGHARVSTALYLHSSLPVKGSPLQHSHEPQPSCSSPLPGDFLARCECVAAAHEELWGCVLGRCWEAPAMKLLSVCSRVWRSELSQIPQWSKSETFCWLQ